MPMMQRISRRVGLAAVVAVAHAPLAAVGGLWCLRREGTRRCRLTGLFCVIERVLTSRRRRPDGVPGAAFGRRVAAAGNANYRQLQPERRLVVAQPRARRAVQLGIDHA